MPSKRKPLIKGRPDYYSTPTHDFRQYTRDCEEKYWNRETAFDWNEDVEGNLRSNMEALEPDQLSRIAFMTLPMVLDNIESRREHVLQQHLPVDRDALKDIGECLPFDCTAIRQALEVQEPLERMHSEVARLKDHLTIHQRELQDLRELQRLGLVRQGIEVRHIVSETEKAEQARELARLTDLASGAREEHNRLRNQIQVETAQLRSKIHGELRNLEQQILEDLEATGSLVRRTLEAGALPGDTRDLAQLKDLVAKRQLRGLKDIANHALVVEQSAIAPLTMGIIHYRRHREIQEAMTTFINDEAKHSATFRRFLVEKLEAREFVSAILIRGANRYMWIARFFPGTGMFLAVIVEAIGAAYLEFFGDEKYMPDKLFRSISRTISMQDEQRHMDLCVAMYNELFRKGSRWERWQNLAALKMIMKSVYGDKTEDHHLIQAFRAFGVESEVLYGHIMTRLSQQLARIGLYVSPDRLLRVIGQK